MNGWVNTLKKKISFKSMRLEMVMGWVENGAYSPSPSLLTSPFCFSLQGKNFPYSRSKWGFNLRRNHGGFTRHFFITYITIWAFVQLYQSLIYLAPIKI